MRIKIETDSEIQNLITLNRLDEILVAKSEDPALRIERIRQAQDEEAWIRGLNITRSDTGRGQFLRIPMNFEVDQHYFLFYCPTTNESAADRNNQMRLVLTETLNQDVLHHYHTSLQGGHQGISRTYDRIRDRFHWRGLYKSVQSYVGECADCETGKGRHRIQGESPVNLQPLYLFQIIDMDHLPSLSSSYKGNTEWLVFENFFSGYLKANS
ncbi:reverse transcriptase, partial [Phytophthora megakarya]